MKILLIGVLAFFSWSVLSNYIYVCKIKELCNETVTMQNNELNPKSMDAQALQDTRVAKRQTIPESLVVYFAFDKSDIHVNDITAEYLDELNAYLNQATRAGMKITGHTDAAGSDDYNQALGFRRAQSVQHYFETKGIPADKMRISSKGELEPSENNSTKDGRAKNRRAVITIKK